MAVFYLHGKTFLAELDSVERKRKNEDPEIEKNKALSDLKNQTAPC